MEEKNKQEKMEESSYRWESEHEQQKEKSLVVRIK